MDRRSITYLGRVREGLNKSRKGGFTLVELMVVVAVIAILAAIAMPQFLSAADRARSAKETADIQIIKKCHPALHDRQECRYTTNS